MTYVYAESTVVLGPLATFAEPHSYDLCDSHSVSLTAPRGWEVVRMVADGDAPEPSDELVALADAVRESSASQTGVVPGQRRRAAPDESGVVEVSRRGHLRVLQSTDGPVAPPG